MLTTPTDTKGLISIKVLYELYDDDIAHNSNKGKNITTVQPVFFEKENRQAKVKSIIFIS